MKLNNPKLFTATFLLNLASIILTQGNLLGIMLIQSWYIKNSSTYSIALTFLKYGLTILTLWYGYQQSKTKKLQKLYRDYLYTIIGAGIASTLFVSLIVLILWPDFISAVAVLIFDFGTEATLFSGLVLGWIYDKELEFKPAFSQDILRLVIVFQLWVLVKGLVNSYMFYNIVRFRSAAFPFTQYVSVINYVGYLIYIVYLFLLFRAGRRVNLAEGYISVLFTFFVLDVGVDVVLGVVNSWVRAQMDLN